MEKYTICVGTVGSGVFSSDDSGRSWRHSNLEMPYPPWAPWVEVRALAVSPHNPRHVLAGSHIGLHFSKNGGKSFEFIRSPADRKQIWSVAFHPQEPDTLLMGIAPFDSEYPLYETRDHGRSWTATSLRMPFRHRINGAVHVTCVLYDPRDPKTIWASGEIDGLHVSRDGGRNWSKFETGTSPIEYDIHCVAVTPNGHVVATSPVGLWISDDDGASFRKDGLEPFEDPISGTSKVAYCRGVICKADEPDVLLAGAGDTTPGRTGAIYRSADGGKTWKRCPLPVPPNSVIYALATHPSKPERMLAATQYGYIYITEDAGLSWSKLDIEFGEIRALAWMPPDPTGMEMRGPPETLGRAL